MNEYIIRLIDLPCTCAGFTIRDDNGFYNIYLNARLSFERMKLAYRREINHIIHGDFDCFFSAHQIENIQDIRKDVR